MENTGLYIHIPFCVKKCNYCDFNSAPFSDEIKELYFNALIRELKIKSGLFENKKIDTLFLGGGTPSTVSVDLIAKLFDCINSFYNLSEDAEISIETNPGTLNSEKLCAYKTFGINRLSIGLQSTVDEELKILGRIHNFNDFLKSFNLARDAGFENINVDLMNSIPNQTFDSFTAGLKRVNNLNPEHISVYSLIIEEGTPFHDMELNLPDEDTDRDMVHSVIDILGDDYFQYEISNYSKKGYECRHNIKYWKREDYEGFGISAASLFDKKIRYKNTNSIYEYIDFLKNDDSFLIDYFRETLKGLNIGKSSPFYSEYEILDIGDMISEYIILGLRMNEGININLFEKEFNKSIFDLKNDKINLHISEGLLERKGDYLRLTESGRDLANYVWADFLGD